jgi:hypothetical protein
MVRLTAGKITPTLVERSSQRCNAIKLLTRISSQGATCPTHAADLRMQPLF